MIRHRPWDGVGIWSSHPCKSPGQVNRESFTEVLCVLAWDERAAKAFRLALADYKAAGSPGIPLGATNYRAVVAARRAKRRTRPAEQSDPPRELK